MKKQNETSWLVIKASKIDKILRWDENFQDPRLPDTCTIHHPVKETPMDGLHGQQCPTKMFKFSTMDYKQACT